MFAALQGRAWGEGPRNSWFVCFNPPHTESHPAYLASTSPPKKKGAHTPWQGPPPVGRPQTPPRSRRGTFPFPPRVPVTNKRDKRQACQSTSEARPRALWDPDPGTQANRPQPDPPGPAAPPHPPPPLWLQPCASLPRAFPPRGSLLPPSASPHHAHRPAATTPPRANLLPSALPAAKPRVTPKPGGRRRRRRGSADAGWEEPGAEQPLG